MIDFVHTEDDGDEIPVEGKQGGADTNIVKHLISSYGGINSLMMSMSGVVRHIPQLRKHKMLSIVGKCVSISMVVYDLFTKVNEFYIDTTISLKDKKLEYIDVILSNDGSYRYRYDNHELKITTEHLRWLVNPHNEDTGDITVKGYYDLTEGTKFNAPPTAKMFAVELEFMDDTMIVEIEQVHVFDSGVSYFFKKLWTLDDDNVKVLVDTMDAKYMESVGVDDNVITYDGINIITRPRSNSINFDIKSIDFDRLKNNITYTLTHGLRRGILFVGNPGTGKTSVLLKLEAELTEFPILYVTANNLNDEYAISRLSGFIHNLGKCVVLIEDMDSLEIDKKTKKIAPLLTLLDNSRNMSPVVFVATINDASLITPSITRTGRFDEIIEIKEPSTNDEIYDIFVSAWNRNVDTNIDRDLSGLTYMRLKRHKLTQSDYCEIIQKIQLNDQYFTDKNVLDAVKELVKSKKAFKKYTDNNE